MLRETGLSINLPSITERSVSAASNSLIVLSASAIWLSQREKPCSIQQSVIESPDKDVLLLRNQYNTFMKKHPNN
tara:strand:- start:512 stop:736 length:225 start_codon:yes stop_codon:yes gene_type:complete